MSSIQAAPRGGGGPSMRAAGGIGSHDPPPSSHQRPDLPEVPCGILEQTCYPVSRGQQSQKGII